VRHPSVSTSQPASAPTTSPPGPRLLAPIIWRDAALLWLGQRALLLLFAYVGAHSIDPRMTPARMLANWTHWDGSIYADIARNGYTIPWQTAFYPLLPGLERLLMVFTGPDSPLAGLIIANLAALIALGLLRALVEREYGRAIAQRTTLYLAVFPTAIYFAAPYTESLFLVLSVACFIALRRKRWLLAGLLAALAALTRPVGVLLIAPMLVEYLMDWRARDWRALSGSERGELARLLGGVALPAFAVAGYYLALVSILGTPSPLQAEQAQWGRSLTLPGMGFVRVGVALFSGPNAYQVGHILLDSAFTILFIVLTIALWRRLHPTYVAYAWVSLILVLMTPLDAKTAVDGWHALASDMRYMLVVFPLFIRLGQWGARPRVNALILGVSLTLLALLTVVFTVGGWVA
jgi:hypothetical protein